MASATFPYKRLYSLPVRANLLASLPKLLVPWLIKYGNVHKIRDGTIRARERAGGSHAHTKY